MMSESNPHLDELRSRADIRFQIYYRYRSEFMQAVYHMIQHSTKKMKKKHCCNFEYKYLDEFGSNSLKAELQAKQEFWDSFRNIKNKQNPNDGNQKHGSMEIYRAISQAK